MNERLYAGWTIEEVELKSFMRSEVGEALLDHIRELQAESETIREFELSHAKVIIELQAQLDKAVERLKIVQMMLRRGRLFGLEDSVKHTLAELDTP